MSKLCYSQIPSYLFRTSYCIRMISRMSEILASNFAIRQELSHRYLVGMCDLSRAVMSSVSDRSSTVRFRQHSCCVDHERVMIVCIELLFPSTCTIGLWRLGTGVYLDLGHRCCSFANILHSWQCKCNLPK